MAVDRLFVIASAGAHIHWSKLSALFYSHFFKLVIAQKDGDVIVIDAKPAQDVASPQHLVADDFLEEGLHLSDDRLRLLGEYLSHANVLGLWVSVSLVCLDALSLYLVYDPLWYGRASSLADGFVPVILKVDQFL